MSPFGYGNVIDMFKMIQDWLAPKKDTSPNTDKKTNSVVESKNKPKQVNETCVPIDSVRFPLNGGGYIIFARVIDANGDTVVDRRTGHSKTISK